MTTNATAAPNATSGGLDPEGLIGWCVGFGVIDVLIIVGNSIAIVVFTRARLLRKRTNYFLFCLAVADIMVGMTSLPMYIHHLVLYARGAPLVTWAVVYTTIDVFFGFASIFALAIISLERLYSVALPNWHRTTPSKIYFALIVLLWTLAAIMAILAILSDKSVNIITSSHRSIVMLVVLFLCLVVIGLAYTVIWIKVKMRFHEKTKKSEEKDRKLAMTLLFVTVIFMVTWLPFYGMNIFYALCGSDSKSCPIITFHAVLFTKFLHFSNSYVNPVIYAFKMPDFRKELLILFGRNPRSRRATQIINGDRRTRKSTFRSSDSNESAL